MPSRSHQRYKEYQDPNITAERYHGCTDDIKRGHAVKQVLQLTNIHVELGCRKLNIPENHQASVIRGRS